MSAGSKSAAATGLEGTLVRDNQERERIEAELREYADRMAEAERIASFGVWKWEIASGRVIWSDELHRIYGLRPGEFAGTVDAFLSFLHPDDRERVWAEVGRSIETLEPFVFEERVTRADGEQRVLLSRGRAIAGDDGRAAALVGVCHDVTARAEAERALGASERRMRAIIDNTPSLITVKDLEGRYLMVNAECARILGVPAEALAGLRCDEVFEPEIAVQQRRNDRIAATECEPVYDESVFVRGDDRRTYVTVTFPLPDDDGRPVATCTIGTDVTDQKEREIERRERLECAERIGSALSDGRMLVFAQPVVNLASGASESYELLIRMAASGGGVSPPGSFLPAAERFGLIQAIDVWMVHRALELSDRFRPEVNLSAVTLCDEPARREIVALLAGAADAAQRIVFEITETAALEHLDAATAFAEDVTALGCGLALDDFGTGFGSFTYLRQLPLRYLKIDGSFVRNLVQSRDDRRVVQSIIGIAEQFDLETIAEGVEDQATLDLLVKLGADYAQGFHLGRPAQVAQIE